MFGCRDGWIYALNCADGQLIWRFRAAPDDSRLVDNGRVESVWPVHGSLLVQDDVVYFAAGRSSYVDGDIRMGRLDLLAGRLVRHKTFYSRDPETGDAVNLFEPFKTTSKLRNMEMPGVLPDVLSSDGQRIWMRSVAFDAELNIQPAPSAHLFSSMGLLDDTWWELSYWIYGKHMFGGRSGIAQAMSLYPTARIMVFSKDKVYGYQEGYEKLPQPGLVAMSKVPKRISPKAASRSLPLVADWRRDVPLHVFGLVLVRDTLFMAGPPRIDTEQTRKLLSTLKTDEYNPPAILAEATEIFLGKRRGVLYAIDKNNGKPVLKKQLDSVPVFDGLIAANHCLFIATKDGRVVCMN